MNTFLKAFAVASLATLPFQLRAQSVITSPMGGEEMLSGSTQTISWNTKLVTGMLTVSLWDGEHGKWLPVFTNVPSEEGKVSWSVPEYLEGHKFRIKVSTTGTMQGSALSRTFFSILPPAPKVEASVPAAATAFELTVHPNPASNYVRLCVPEIPAGMQATMVVVNTAGEVVATLYNATPEGD